MVAEALEITHSIDTVVLDKTGTITTGANVAQNTTGLTAYYFSHNGLTSEADEQLIPWLQAILASLEA